jgi:hypothetical protein
LTDEEKKKQIKHQQLDDLKWVLSDPRGRRFLGWILEIGNAFKHCNNGNSKDFYENGKHEIGNALETLIVEAKGFYVFDQIKKDVENEINKFKEVK